MCICDIYYNLPISTGIFNLGYTETHIQRLLILFSDSLLSYKYIFKMSNSLKCRGFTYEKHSLNVASKGHTLFVISNNYFKVISKRQNIVLNGK